MSIPRAALLSLVLAFACTSPEAPPQGDCMTLPASRNLTMDGVTPIPSSLLNALQDCVTGMKFPSHTKWYPFPRGATEQNISYADPGGSIEGIWDTLGGATWEGMVSLGLPPGTRITDFKVYMKGTGGAQTVQVLLNVYGPTLAFGTLASVSAVNPPAARTLYSAGAFTPYTTVDGDIFSLKALTHILNTGVYGFGVTVDRL